jgi:hypothetical protein
VDKDEEIMNEWVYDASCALNHLQFWCYKILVLDFSCTMKQRFLKS